MSISQGQFYQRCACIGHCTNFGIVPTICNCQEDKLRIKRSLWIVPYYNWEILPTTTARSFWARPWCVSACADSYRRALDPLHKSCSRPERQQKLRIETTIVTTANTVVSTSLWPKYIFLWNVYFQEYESLLLDQSLGRQMHDKERLYPRPKFLVLAEVHLSAKFGPNILDFFDLVYISSLGVHAWIHTQKLFLSQIHLLLFLSTLYFPTNPWKFEKENQSRHFKHVQFLKPCLL